MTYSHHIFLDTNDLLVMKNSTFRQHKIRNWQNVTYKCCTFRYFLRQILWCLDTTWAVFFV